MTNYTTIQLTSMKAEELRVIAKSIQMPGAWKAKKSELITFIENHIAAIKEEERLAAEAQQIEEKPQTSNRRGRTRTIEIYKDGALINTIEGLLETFKWAADNQIANQGWVKHSLKTGKETVAGRKFKEGGYLFKYSK